MTIARASRHARLEAELVSRDAGSEPLRQIANVMHSWGFLLPAKLLSLIFLPLYLDDGALFASAQIALLLGLSLTLDTLIAGAGQAIARSPRLARMMLGGPLLLGATGAIGLSSFSFAWVFASATMMPQTTGPGHGFGITFAGYVLLAGWACAQNRHCTAVFVAATWVGLMLAVGSGPIIAQAVTFLILSAAMLWFVRRENQRLEALRLVSINEQQRAMNLVRDFEDAGRGWFWETDRHGALVYISPIIARQFGVDPPELIGRAFTDLIHKKGSAATEDRTLGFSLSSRTPFKELTVQAATRGEERFWSICGNPISNEFGHFLGFRGSGTDLTEVKKSEREINQLARYDTLTGLANRLHINEILERSLRNHFGQPQPCALFLLDLDRFKAVNDTLGHPVGDQLLQQVAGRLRQVVGDRGQVGRLGGDEFQIVFPQLINREKLGDIAREIIISMAKPFAIEGEQVRIGSSVGIALADGSQIAASALVRHADLALYAAKDGGRGTHRFYVDDMHNQASERKAIGDALRDALARDQLEVWYQPIVDVQTEIITGFEALIRWNHPERGMISPAKFIPIAEESGLIVPIGDWVLRTACETMKLMGPSYRVAVNVSPRQFMTPSLPATIIGAVAASGVRQQQLELEITEGIFLDESETNIAMFRKLQHTGVRLALDDFGTGYSALGYLKKAPFNKIKIDQSFVRGAAQPGSMNAAIIASIVSLARALNMETTAEGVETHDELELMKGLGCSHVQGYIYGAPMPRDEALRLLQTGGGRVVANGFKSARETRKRTLRAVVLETGGHKYEATLRNVSSRGAMIEGLWNVPAGTRFAVELAPGLTLFAATRWSVDNRMGVEFESAIDIEMLSAGAAQQTGALRLAS